MENHWWREEGVDHGGGGSKQQGERERERGRKVKIKHATGGRCSKAGWREAQREKGGKGMREGKPSSSNPRTLERAKENAKSIAQGSVSLLFLLARRTPFRSLFESLAGKGKERRINRVGNKFF